MIAPLNLGNGASMYSWLLCIKVNAGCPFAVRPGCRRSRSAFCKQLRPAESVDVHGYLDDQRDKLELQHDCRSSPISWGHALSVTAYLVLRDQECISHLYLALYYGKANVPVWQVLYLSLHCWHTHTSIHIANCPNPCFLNPSLLFLFSLLLCISIHPHMNHFSVPQISAQTCRATWRRTTTATYK